MSRLGTLARFGVAVAAGYVVSARRERPVDVVAALRLEGALGDAGDMDVAVGKLDAKARFDCAAIDDDGLEVRTLLNRQLNLVVDELGERNGMNLSQEDEPRLLGILLARQIRRVNGVQP